MKKYLVALLIIPLLFACKSKPKDEFALEGIITGGSGQKVLLQELQAKKVLPLDSTNLNPEGKFSFFKPLKTRSFFILRIGDKKLILAPDKGDRIRITGSMTEPSASFGISGSKDTEIFQEFLRRSAGNKQKADSLKQVLKDHENMENMMQISQGVDSAFKKVMQNQRDIQREFILSNPGSLADLLVLNYTIGSQPVLDPIEDFRLFSQTDSLLQQKYPENPHVMYHHQRVEALRNTMQIRDLMMKQKKQ